MDFLFTLFEALFSPENWGWNEYILIFIAVISLLVGVLEFLLGVDWKDQESIFKWGIRSIKLFFAGASTLVIIFVPALAVPEIAYDSLGLVWTIVITSIVYLIIIALLIHFNV